MALYVQTNVGSLNAQNNLDRTSKALQISMARLSSGYRINSAADDAAGLGISTTMGAQIRSYSMAERNANDGISALQVADGAASQTAGVLTRMRELAVQSMNGTYTTKDRNNLTTEFSQLQSEMNRIAQSTEFNSVKLGSASFSMKIQVGTKSSAMNQITVSFGSITAKSLAVSAIGVSTMARASAAVFAIDDALNQLSVKRTKLGASMNRLNVAVANIQSMRTNLSAANSRIKDVDVADEASTMSRLEVLNQAGQSILSQANQQPQAALSLLR